MERFRFDEIRTPILEPIELIARGVGSTTDIVQKEMFVVPREDEQYVLRPEVTAPVMRAYLQYGMDQRGGPQRLYYIGPCFRAERPQKGRYRQFHQFGVELLGAAGPSADAEVIANMWSVYDAFALTGMRLRINSLGGGATRTRYRDALREFLQPHASDLSETSRNRLDTNPLRILDTKLEHERKLLENAPSLPNFISSEEREHYEQVKSLLAVVGISFTEDPRLVRGLDYYTGVVFELESDTLGAQSALAAGGRYDVLAESLGARQAVPAVGYAAGIERLLMALDAAGRTAMPSPVPDAYIVALEGGAEAAFAVAASLRKSGLSISQTVEAGSFKRLMKDAERSGARWYVLVGEREAAAGTAILKDATTGEQRELDVDGMALALGDGLQAES